AGVIGTGPAAGVDRPPVNVVDGGLGDPRPVESGLRVEADRVADVPGDRPGAADQRCAVAGIPKPVPVHVDLARVGHELTVVVAARRRPAALVVADRPVPVVVWNTVVVVVRIEVVGRSVSVSVLIELVLTDVGGGRPVVVTVRRTGVFVPVPRRAVGVLGGIRITS